MATAECNWNSNVNTKVRRNGTSWNYPSGVIEDETKSGKVKRRATLTMKKPQFNVSMLFSLQEYEYFIEWYKSTTLYGALSFSFPKIDGAGLGVYRFIAGTSPQFNNPNGIYVECTMQWEEV